MVKRPRIPREPPQQPAFKAKDLAVERTHRRPLPIALATPSLESDIVSGRFYG